MKNICLLIIFLSIFGIFAFSEEVTILNDSTRITREMVSPTENVEAMEAYNIGTYLLQQRNFPEAEIFLLRAIESDNLFVDAMDHLGLVYRNLERYNDAEYWYLKSIEINPDNLVPYINLAIVYRFQGRLEDARQTYIRAQRIDQNDPEPYYGIGVLYQMAGQYRFSIEYISAAMYIYNERNSLLIFNAFYIQGNNYYYLEEYDEALRFLKASLIYHTDNISIQNRINEIENILNIN